MTRSMCDYVLLNADKADFLSLDKADDEIRAHLEVCAHCAEVLARKSAIQHLVSQVQMDPILARRLSVGALSVKRRRSTFKRPRRVPQLAWTAVFGVTAAGFGFLLVYLFHSWSAEKPLSPPKTVAVASPTASVPKPSESIPAGSVREGRPMASEKRIDTAGAPETVITAHGTKVWVKEDSDMVVVSDNAQLTRTRLMHGRVIVDIPRRVPGFRFIVETPRAEVESLGTVFAVEVREDGSELFRVMKSAVVVRPKDGAEPVVVRAGEKLSLDAAIPEVADVKALEADLRLVNHGRHDGNVDGRVTEGRETAMPEARIISTIPREGRSLALSVHEDVPDSTVHGGVAAPVSADVSADMPDAKESDAEWTHRVYPSAASGESSSPSRSQPEDAEKSADDNKLEQLLRQAMTYRNERQFKRAVAVYEQIFEAFPERDAAINGLVSVAQIKQGMLGDSAGALDYYERYLKKRPRGGLAEAAFAGKIRALYKLKKWADVVNASAAYMRLFSGGLSEREVRQKRKMALEEMKRD